MFYLFPSSHLHAKIVDLLEADRASSATTTVVLLSVGLHLDEVRDRRLHDKSHGLCQAPHSAEVARVMKGDGIRVLARIQFDLAITDVSCRRIEHGRDLKGKIATKVLGKDLLYLGGMTALPHNQLFNFELLYGLVKLFDNRLEPSVIVKEAIIDGIGGGPCPNGPVGLRGKKSRCASHEGIGLHDVIADRCQIEDFRPLLADGKCDREPRFLLHLFAKKLQRIDESDFRDG